MSAPSEISKEDLYKIFLNLESLKRDLIKEKSNETEALIGVLDEVLKLRADVEKLKANQSEPINE